MKRTSSISPSFFDHHDGSSSFEFVKPGLRHRLHLDKQAITKASFSCKNLRTGAVLTGAFKLQGHLLAYYKDEQSEAPQLVLDVLYARLKPLEINQTNPKYKFTIIKNEVSFELAFLKQSTAEYWIQSLKSICVLTDFYGKYVPIRLSNKSSFSSIHLVKAKSTSDIFIIKRFSKENLASANLKNLILNEISLARLTDHPNLVKLVEIYETETSIHLVKEYSNGQSLRSFLENPDSLICHSNLKISQIINSILQVLAYLASKGVIHRDLNPENILIDTEGTCKVIDYGLVNYLNLSTFMENGNESLGYIAPEVFAFNKRDPATSYNEKCDVFSAGCILYELLFGRPLFEPQGTLSVLDLNKCFCYATTCETITDEFLNPGSNINKQGLDLLMRLLEPDQFKRISATEALEHPYFNMDDNRAVKFNTLNDVLLYSIGARYTSTDQSPLRSPDKSSIYLEKSISQLIKEDNNKANHAPAAMNMKYTRNQSLIRGSQGKATTLEDIVENQENQRTSASLSYYDLANKNRKAYLKKEVVSDDEDNDDFFNVDDEKKGIKKFMETHCIRIMIKNPGKMF